MTTYYDEQAKQELFSEQWVSREDYNALLDKYEASKANAEFLQIRQKDLDDAIYSIQEIKEGLGRNLITLRKGSDWLERSSGLILDEIENTLNPGR